MKTKFDMVDGISTVADAINQMSHVETKCLVVRKRNENDEYGLVMLSDIAREVLAKDKSPSRTNIYEIMSKPVITVDPDMDIRYCARLFARFHLSRAPVVDNGNIVGIVSFTDMILKGLRQK
ncbi:CBS domain-containing protein [Accumulibacter sp.]|nr:CBS domain-containing protein [Accumulibacter sp.]HRF03658.1 CBS domain-containing protein [Accumulibacter sp.]